MRGGYISTYEDLEKWFMPMNHSGWSIYHGFQRGRLNNSNLYFKMDDTNIDVEASYEKMRELLEMSSNGQGGQFTIYVPYKSSNNGAKIYFSTATNLPGQSSQVSGIPGVYGSIERILEKEKKMWELEATVEGLLEQKDQEKSMTERVIERVMDDLDVNQVAMGIMGFLNKFIPQQTPITVQGTMSESKQKENPEENTGEEHGFQYDGKIVLPILDLIRRHFETNEEFYQALDKMANMFAANPDFFKNQIKNG